MQGMLYKWSSRWDKIKLKLTSDNSYSLAVLSPFFHKVLLLVTGRLLPQVLPNFWTLQYYSDFTCLTLLVAKGVHLRKGATAMRVDKHTKMDDKTNTSDCEHSSFSWECGII